MAYRSISLSRPVKRTTIGCVRLSSALASTNDARGYEADWIRELARQQVSRLDTDKLAANYLAFIKRASIRIWLRVNESTP
jgi:transposase